ncbi:L10-interacting MYB domain-containing protein [Abeliophyllum distichum]|uniref:L10-interacting MYB domain-containing protein n=1 Tax=Abeliophyllum distichum TaxID=126358 RepID=A0ABD1RQZ3_9LAMI
MRCCRSPCATTGLPGCESQREEYFAVNHARRQCHTRCHAPREAAASRISTRLTRRRRILHAKHALVGFVRLITVNPDMVSDFPDDERFGWNLDLKSRDTQKHIRRPAKWDDDIHRIFVNCCELLISQGYRQGKCFNKSGWQQLVSMFNTEAGKDWNRVQLKNHWFSMRKEYQLLHELLRCTGIEYDHQTNIIVADDWWWERKIQANKEFEKFRGRDCGEIFHKYSQLFGDAYDSEKYAVSPTKLSKKGFDDDEVWEQVGHTDKLPVNAEMHDEHAPSEFQGCGSPMDTSALHSGDKRKCSYGSAKGKKKLSSHAALSESVEKLANVGNDLIAAHLKANSGPPSIDECLEELESFGLLENDEKLHLFALSFLDQKRHRAAYAAARTPQMKMKFFKFKFKAWCLKNAGALDD